MEESTYFAAEREARGVKWSLERSRAVRAKVDGALRNWAPDVVGNTHRQIVPIDQRNYPTNPSKYTLKKDQARVPSYQSTPPPALNVHSATLAGGTPVPVLESHFRPPLHPPSAQEFGPGLVEKLQLRRPQIRPAFQLSGTVKVRFVYAAASQPVSTLGTAVPTLRSVCVYESE